MIYSAFCFTNTFYFVLSVLCITIVSIIHYLIQMLFLRVFCSLPSPPFLWKLLLFYFDHTFGTCPSQVSIFSLISFDIPDVQTAPSVPCLFLLFTLSRNALGHKFFLTFTFSKYRNFVQYSLLNFKFRLRTLILKFLFWNFLI